MKKSNRVLVDKAKSLGDPRVGATIYTDEEIELVLAWAAGEVTISQLSRAVNLRSVSAAYAYIAQVLRQFLMSQPPV
jgi:hypothetical protein